MKKDLTRLLKSTAIYGTGQILTRAISFFLLPIFTAYLTPSDYGIYGILSMVNFLLVPIFSLGFGTSIGVCYFNDPEQGKKEATIWSSFVLLLFSTATLCVIGIILDKKISLLAFQTDEYAYFVILTIITTSFSILVTPFMLYLQFEEMALKFVVISGISTMFSIAINVFMVVGMELGITGLVEGSLIGQIFNFLIFSFYPLKKIPFRIDGAVSKDLLYNGLPMIPSFASLFLLQQGNRYVLQWYHGLTTVGIYTIGYSIGMFMNVLVNAFQTAWVPFFLSFSDKKEEARFLFGRILTYYSIGFGFVSLLFYVYARPVVLLMTAPSFFDSYKIIGLVSTSQWLLGVFAILLPPVYFAKNVKIVILVQGLSAILSFGMNFLLIPYWGTMGAAFVLMAGMLLMCFIQYLWNFLNKDRYLQIVYDGRRILLIAVVYAIISYLLVMERNLLIYLEIILSLLITLFLALIAFLALTISERRETIRYAKSILYFR